MLVTGAAGSIGSELCRQIASFRPRVIVAFDISETGLFHLDREMRKTFPEISFSPEIGNVQNGLRIDEVIQRYHPAILYHAAAYKHVPLMEANAFEAVENNVLGTWNVAVASERHGVKDFVFISSDKAVRPASIMGATKRLSELMIAGLSDNSIKFVSVRFGNVLESSGSVIPVFKEQIASGGPVTITHPDMQRYFMSVTEASQMVLQASTMGAGREIFVLDMGQPVRIADLARDLIARAGREQDSDIGIEFTGIRPGEKLREELNLHDETMLTTSHEKIRIFAGQGLPSGAARSCAERVRGICAGRDLAALVQLLTELIPDYSPSDYLLAGIE